MHIAKQIGLIVVLMLTLVLPVAAQDDIGGGRDGAWPPAGLQTPNDGVVVPATETGRIKFLSESLKMAPDALLKLNSSEMLALVVKNTDVLRMDVFKLTEVDGKSTYRQVGFSLACCGSPIPPLSHRYLLHLLLP